VLREVEFDEPEAARLSEAMAAEMAARYGGGGASPASASLFSTPPGVFLVAELEGRSVGCGGLCLFETGVGEVKRMYVEPEARGRGVARALLRALVAHARGTGLVRVQLETGTEQPESVALYRSEGFTPIPAYGHYRADPRSLCFALDLT